MFNVILFQPEIPPNTGNVIRLCANSGAQLHLIRPLGFELDDKQLRRAGLDYHEYATMQVYDSLRDCLDSLRVLPGAPPHPSHLTAGEEGDAPRLFAFTTKGAHPFHEAAFRQGDALLFGPESRGLPADILDALPAQQKLRLPMLPSNRSLNLSNTVAIAVYEAWRQCGYVGGV